MTRHRAARRVTLAALAAVIGGVSAQARATPPCRFPWSRPIEDSSRWQDTPPHAALLEAPPALVPREAEPALRKTVLETTPPCEATCATDDHCATRRPSLETDRVFVVRAERGGILAAARGTSRPELELPGSVGAIRCEVRRLGTAVKLLRRAEIAEPAGVVLFSTPEEDPLDPDGIYVWDEPTSPLPSLVAVTLSDRKLPPELPMLVPEPLRGDGACPAHGGVALVPPSPAPGIVYRWSLLDWRGDPLPSPAHIGPRPQIHATASATQDPRLGESYVLEVEALDPNGHASPRARFPVPLEKTGGASFARELLGIVVWLALWAAPVVGLFAVVTGAILLSRRLLRRRRPEPTDVD